MATMKIGNGVVDTDDVEAQGFDYVGLKMAGMLKAPEQQVDSDLTLASSIKYTPPEYEST